MENSLPVPPEQETPDLNPAAESMDTDDDDFLVEPSGEDLDDPEDDDW